MSIPVHQIICAPTSGGAEGLRVQRAIEMWFLSTRKIAKTKITNAIPDRRQKLS